MTDFHKLSDLGQHLFDTALAMNRVNRDATSIFNELQEAWKDTSRADRTTQILNIARAQLETLEAEQAADEPTERDDYDHYDCGPDWWEE